MKRISRSAKIYLTFVFTLASACFSFTITSFTIEYQPILFILGLIMYVSIDIFEAKIRVQEKNSLVLTITSALTIFLVIVSGSLGLLIAILGTVITDIFLKVTWYKIIFNCSLRTIIYSSLLFAYVLFENQVNHIVLFGSMAIIHYVLNNILLITMIALATNRSWLHIWKTNAMYSLLAHGITMPCGVMMGLLWSIDTNFIVLGLIPLFVAQYSFRLIANASTVKTLSRVLEDLRTKKIYPY